MTPAPASTARRMSLADGRTLAWSDYGDPCGEPVLYCHGFPACRLEARMAAGAAARRGVRLIAPDRPGFGESSPSWGRRVSDWPEDVVQLLDGLGIARCRVLGMSGGGPYALACATVLGERIAAVGLMGALGPLDRPGATRGMSALARVSFQLARAHPRAHATLYHTLGQLVRRTPSALLGSVLAPGCSADRTALAQPGLRALLLATMRGSVRQGARPAIEELRRYGEPWPFALQDVRTPVRLWHGTADAVVPPAHAHAIAAALPLAHCCFVRGEGHLSLPVRRMDAILRLICSESR